MTVPSPISSFKNWCIFLLLLAVIVLCLTRGCNSPTPSVVTQNKIIQDTVAKIVAIANAANQQANRLRGDSIRLEQHYQQAEDSLTQSTRIIHAANSQVTALANEVADARIHHDTAHYISACDSLAKENKLNAGKFAMFERDNKNALNACDLLSAKKSQIIGALTSEANGFKSAYQMEDKENKAIMKAFQPKNKVYLGLDAQFSTVNLFQSAGVGVLWQTKKDDLYRLSVGMMRQPTVPIGTIPGYVEIGAYRKLSFHR